MINRAYAKAIIYAYPMLGEIIENLEKEIKTKCYGSKFNIAPVEDQFNDIYKDVNRRYDLCILKACIEEVAEDFKSVDREILDFNMRICSAKILKTLPGPFYNRCWERVQDLFCWGLSEHEVDTNWLIEIVNTNAFINRYIPVEEKINLNKKGE